MLVPILVAVAALAAAYLYLKAYHKRFVQYANFPQLTTSLPLGHLAVVDEYIKRLPPKAHVDMAFAEMHESLGRPPVMVVDMRPVASCMLIIGSYDIAEQISKATDKFPVTPPKVPEVWKPME